MSPLFPILAAVASASLTHPLHTTLTTIEWRAETRRLEIVVRAFTLDLNDALARRARHRTACDYAQDAIVVRDAAGLVPTTGRCTARDSGDVTWIWMETRVVDRAAGLQVSNALLFESFEDQVNVVQTTLSGRLRTVLFTRGDGPKAIGARAVLDPRGAPG